MAYYLTYGDNTLFDPYTSDTIYDAKLTCKSNTADYLDFTVPYGHTYYDSVVERGYTVTLKWDNTVLFYGEVESIDTDFEGNKAVSCIGGLDWLNATVVRPYSTVAGEAALTAPTAVNALFEWYIEQHNEHIKDSRKGFAIGVNEGNLLDENNYVYRSSTSYPATWDEINDKIIDELGGYVTVTYNPLTINLYADIHSTNSQVIDFGVNLLDFTKNVATDSQATAVLPTGAQLYFHVKYSDTTSPASSEDISDTPKTYIGTYVDNNSSDETEDFSVYTWQTYSSCRGSSGADGILGTLSDSTKLYLHVAYASSSDGSSGFSKTDANNKSYLGQYVDYTLEGSDKYAAYSWEEYSPVTYDEEGKEDTSGSGVHCPNSHDGPVVMIDNLPDGVTSYSSDFIKSGDVVYSQAGVNRYGYIEYQYSNDDITLPNNMLTKACQALNNLISPVTTIDISAVDLALYMDGYDHLEVGQAVRIRSNFHNTDEYLMVESIDLDLLDPSSTSYTLGGEYDTLTGQQSKYLKNLNSNVNKSLDSVAALTDDVKNSAKEIEAAQGAAASAEKAASDAKDTAVEAEKAASEASGAVAAAVVKYDKAIEDLQKQVDGSIETWFYGEVPTLTNEPAKDWTTDTDKNKHLGDLYYDTATGYCYRWQNQNGIYSWSRITDTDVTKALEAAKNAQDTADHKRTIFVDTPTVPYEIGDLWVQGDSGDILRCMTARKSTEAYSASDWEIASKYTDDSVANEAKDAADTATTTANAAKEAADKAATDIVTEYATSTSPTVEPTSGWSTTAPAYVEGQYIWMHHIVTYGSGKTETTDAVLLTGNQGETGPQGAQGIQGIQGERGEDGVRGSLTLTIHTEPTLGDGRWDYACRIETATVLSESGASDVRVNDQLLYSWSGSKDDFGTMQYEVAALDETYTYTNSPVCLSGVNGADGVGVASIVEQYYQSTSSTKQAGGSWGTSVPTWADGKYIWTRSVITYTDKTTKTTDPVCVTGSKGATGGSGSKGDTGTGVQSVDVWYYLSTSATKLDGGSWSTTAPAWVNGKYMWSKTVTTYTDGTSAESAAACITGAKGSTGASQYFHIKYSPVASPTAGQMTEEPDVYIGTYVDTSAADSTDPAKYTWSRFQGAQGEKGEQGIQGKSGTDGKTYYLHIAYANSADGKTDFSTTDSAGKSYIGQYTDTTAADSTDPTKYSWTKIKGETGATGAQGPKGDTGATGAKGADGKSPTATVTKSGTTATITVNNTDGTSTTATVSDGAKGEKGDAGAGFAWNLLKDSRFTSSSHYWLTGNGVTVSYESMSQPPSAEASGDNMMRVIMPSGSRILYDTSQFKHTVGNTYTFAIWYYVSTNQTKDCTLRIMVGVDNQVIKTVDLPAKDCTWRRVTGTYVAQYPYSISLNMSAGTHVCFWHPYLANGETAAEWCTTQAETIGAKGTDGSSVTAVKLQYAICDSSTTAPTSSWQDSVPDWQTGKYIWQRSVTTIKAASGTTTTQYGTAVLYGAFTSLAKSVDGNSSKITQTADALGVTFDSSGNATSTLIRETSDGIEVGKSTDGSTYTGTHTLVGTDAFAIHDKEHNTLASFGSDSIDLLQGAGEMQIGKYAVGAAATEPQFRLCSPKERPIVMQTPASVTSYRASSARLELAADGAEYYDNDGTVHTYHGDGVDLRAGADNYCVDIDMKAQKDIQSLLVGIYAGAASFYANMQAVYSGNTGNTCLSLTSTDQVNGSASFSGSMSDLVRMLQPTCWTFCENTSGGTYTCSIGWENSSVMTTLYGGSSNWSNFFTKTASSITIKVAGVYRFHGQLCAYNEKDRTGFGVFIGSSEKLSGFGEPSNSCTCHYDGVLNLTAGTTLTFKEYCTGGTKGMTKYLNQLTNVTIEYLGHA